MQNPDATVADRAITDDATYEPRIFSTRGRLGRIRYIAYYLPFWIIFGPPGDFISRLVNAGNTSALMKMGIHTLDRHAPDHDETPAQ